MEWDLILRWLHLIGAAVLFGTGAGIAFFMLMAHLSGRVAVIAHTSRIVVLADMLFTATAAIAQPITGVLLARATGWDLTEGWVLLSIALYLFVGACWLPVVWIQARMRDLAMAAEQAGQDLPARYHRLFRIWFVLGFPAFATMMAILWLMLARPDLAGWNGDRPVIAEAACRPSATRRGGGAETLAAARPWA